MPLPTGPTVPIKFQKAISSLPNTLTPNSLYAVRVGEGFDLYVSDMTGNIAFKSNSTVGPKGDTGDTGQGFTFIGVWDVEWNYVPYDVVTYNGESYVCVNTPDSHQNPTVSYFWTKLVEKGPQGPQGEIGPTGPQGEIGPSPATTIYTAQTIDLTNGVYVSGDVTSIQNFNDGQSYALTDGSHAGPAWIVDATFTGVTSFNQVDLNISYTVSSGHTIFIQLYNNTTEGWDNIGSYNGLSGYTQFQLGVISGTSYINSGTVLVRLYHNNTGNPAHQTFIDYIAVVDSIAGGQGPRGLTGAQGPKGLLGDVGLYSSISNTTASTISSITSLKFDTDAGFSLTDLGGGSALVGMNSTFKYISVDGQNQLVAQGLDTLRLIAGSGIDITTDNASSPQSLTINATGTGGSGGGTGIIKTFNILNSFSAPLIGNSIFVPTTADYIKSVQLTNSQPVGTDLTIGLYRNNELLGFYSIPAGQITATYSTGNFRITPSDYITVNVVAGQGLNFSLVLLNIV